MIRCLKQNNIVRRDENRKRNLEHNQLIVNNLVSPSFTDIQSRNMVWMEEDCNMLDVFLS